MLMPQFTENNCVFLIIFIIHSFKIFLPFWLAQIPQLAYCRETNRSSLSTTISGKHRMQNLSNNYKVSFSAARMTINTQHFSLFWSYT